MYSQIITPLASWNSASGRPRHRGVIVYSYFMPVCSIVKTITPRCRGRPDELLQSDLLGFPR